MVNTEATIPPQTLKTQLSPQSRSMRKSSRLWTDQARLWFAQFEAVVINQRLPDIACYNLTATTPTTREALPDAPYETSTGRRSSIPLHPFHSIHSNPLSGHQPYVDEISVSMVIKRMGRTQPVGMKLTDSAPDPARPHAAEGTTRTAVNNRDQRNGNRDVVEPQRIRLASFYHLRFRDKARKCATVQLDTETEN
ncbi:hypothetical protein EVAR_23761_1 [Eumeta japonica]|uniref:Uncharacterized protein n=1 Tax=Eumeta variegata TaxID=151549 RepID=A0A4C1VH96_EUMVA|nr:hypothetical protein EVAR_23761_1 [Eumeta japonica]